MTIQWSGEDEPASPETRGDVRTALPIGTMGHIIPIEEGRLPSARSVRDVLVIVAFVVLLIVAGAALWWFGPLPRVFPLMS